jgi:hypothetical protein
MQTLVDFRSTPISPVPARLCACGCGKSVPPPKQKWYSDKCRWVADEDARKVLSTLSHHHEIGTATSEKMLALIPLLETRSSARSAREEQAFEQLDKLDLLILSQGLSEAEVRSEVRLIAGAFRLDFLALRPANIGEMLQYGRTIEILRDVGVSAQAGISEIRQYGWEAILIYKQLKQFPALVRALMAYGNPCRLAHEERTTRKMMRMARHIAEQKCNLNEPNVPTLLHGTLVWNLRYFGHDWERNEQIEVCELIEDLAQDLGTPSILLQTYRELAAFHCNEGQLEKSLEYCKQMEYVLNANTFPTYGRSSLLRPKIEILKRLGRRDEMVAVIEEYRKLYDSDRHLYHREQLKKWKKQLRLGFDLPEAQFATGVLAYTPRWEMN